MLAVSVRINLACGAEGIHIQISVQRVLNSVMQLSRDHCQSTWPHVFEGVPQTLHIVSHQLSLCYFARYDTPDVLHLPHVGLAAPTQSGAPVHDRHKSIMRHKPTLTVIGVDTNWDGIPVVLCSPVPPHSMHTLGYDAKMYRSPLANTYAMFETIAGFGLESSFVAPSAESKVPLTRTPDSVKLLSSIRGGHVLCFASPSAVCCTVACRGKNLPAPAVNFCLSSFSWV